MRTLLLTFFVYASFTNAASLGVRSWQENSVGVEGIDNTVDRDQVRTTFSRLLSAVSPRALQQLVHEYVPNPFKDGVFSSDRNAEDGVYVRGPIFATSIVHLAVRQATSGNDTSTSDTPTSSDDAPTTSTSDVPSTTSTEEPTTSTEEPTTSTEEPTTSTEEPTTSTEEPTTSTEAPPTESTETPSDTPTTSSESPTTPTPTPAPAPAPTTEPSSTTETPTDTPGPTSSSPAPTSESSSDMDSSSTPSTFSTSTTPTPTSKTMTFVSTLPGGAVTTVTEVAVVTPGASEGDSDDSAPTDSMGNLQTDSPAAIVRGPGFAVIAGFLVGGFMLA
ncbi:hypothetical protein CHU98_g6855 [Xylaria longipes]|nr:hypothetical protein CHU98_g6855 [Xylaria longipes]